MWADLATRASLLTEAMDAPDCHSVRLTRTYQQFSALNRVLSGWGLLYKKFLRPELAAGARTILDIGCGGGDVLRLLSHLAQRDGFRVEGLGVDPDARAIDFAQAQANPHNLQFRQANSSELNEPFDMVISNHVLHHLADNEVTGFCQESQRLACKLVLHNDIRRSALAYALFPFTGLVFHGSYIVSDGLISIRRSFIEPELREKLPGGWDVTQYGAFRLQAVWKP
ncbi:MAG: methyltransferase domain-containing protein [Armatimonas sp.]